MHQRNRVWPIIGVLLLMTWGGVLAQDDDTPDLEDEIQQTVNAGVEARFTQTAEATRNLSVIQTIDASVYNALTATDAARLPTLAAQPTLTAAAVDEVIDQIVVPSDLVNVTGGTYDMGTTVSEVITAVNLCVNEQAGNCTAAMGEDSVPAHSVTINAFQIEMTEVTYRQFVDFLNLMGENSHLSACDAQRCAAIVGESESSNIALIDGRYTVAPEILEYPVANVTWYGADAYCRAFGRRLPTEAEWELAARGFEGRIYPWGNEWNPDFAKTSIPATDEAGALPVFNYMAGSSPFGALQMAGNVAEWVEDWYDPTFYSQPDATGLNPLRANAGEQKVIRGGSWDAKPFFARSVHRQSLGPMDSGAWLGFRCAADLDASVELSPTALTPSVTKTATVYTETPTYTPTWPNTATPDPRVTPSPTMTPT